MQASRPLPPGAKKASASPKASSNAPATTAGWNFKVCVDTETFTDGFWSAVFINNSDNSVFWSVSNGLEATFQAQFTAACQRGSAGYYIYVTDVRKNTFDALFIPYP